MKAAVAKLVQLLPPSRVANPWVLLALTPPMIFFGSMTYVPGATHDLVFVYSALILCRLASSIAVMVFAPLILKWFSKPSIWPILLTYFIGGLADSLVLIFMLDIPWITPGTGLSAWAVISVSAVIVAAWILMGHLALSLLISNLEHLAELQLKNTQLQLLTENAADELRRHRESLQFEITERVHGVLDRISEQLSKLHFQADPEAILATAQSIRESSDVDIRALSHELSEPTQADFLPSVPKYRTDWRAFLRIGGDASANIPWVASVGVLMAFSMAIAIGNGLTFIVVAIALAIGLPALWLVDILRSRITSRWPTWLRILSVPVEYVGMALLGVEIVRAFTRDIAQLQESLVLFSIAVPVGAVVIWSLIFVIRGFSSAIEGRSKVLERTSAELQVTLDRLQGQLRDVRNRLARLLHGSVQGRLASVSLALAATAGQNDRALSDEMGNRARAQLELARKDLDEAFSDSRTQPIFSHALKELLAGWKGLIGSNLLISDEIVRHLDSDQMLGEIVIHAVQECFTNAVRHGSARQIQFEFSVIEGDLSVLKMVATNDGTGEAKNIKPGLGWQTMVADAQSLEVQRTPTTFQISITWMLAAQPLIKGQ